MHTTVKIVYSRAFRERYSTNPVEDPDRVALPAQVLLDEVTNLLSPSASLQDIVRVHGLGHIKDVKNPGACTMPPPSLPEEPSPLLSWPCWESQPSHSFARPGTTLQPTGPGGCATSTIWP